MTNTAQRGGLLRDGVASCCAASYGSPWVKWLLGDSFHPGGLQLTTRLAGLMGIDSSSSVLDVGSGLGTTAVHLAETSGAKVHGVTLEMEGVLAGRERARERGLAERVSFSQGDIQTWGHPERFDFVMMECVLSILEPKAETLRQAIEFLTPGGVVGITDVTVDGTLPAELTGVRSAAGCVGGALSLGGYRELLERWRFEVEVAEDTSHVAHPFLRGLSRKLTMAKVAARFGALPIDKAVLAEAGRLLETVEDLVQRGILGYGLLVARKPQVTADRQES